VLNKTDLPQSDSIEKELLDYQNLATVYRVSGQGSIGLDELKRALKDQLSMLAGQSGGRQVSLTNAIIPDKDLKTNTISAPLNTGDIPRQRRHCIIEWRRDLIDSPGVAFSGWRTFRTTTGIRLQGVSTTAG